MNKHVVVASAVQSKEDKERAGDSFHGKKSVF
jgi:hypothetical protein